MMRIFELKVKVFSPKESVDVSMVWSELSLPEGRNGCFIYFSAVTVPPTLVFSRGDTFLGPIDNVGT